jgi:drug/metabolite transporter (DMT)-like permease
MYIALALLCMVLSAIQEIMGKEVANQKIKSETMFINVYLFLGILKILLIIVTVGASFVFRPLMLLLLIPNTIIAAIINYLYIKSLKLLPVSVVVPMYLIYYPLSMLFSIGLLKEEVSFMQLIAMAVIFVLILILSISTSKNRLNKGINEEHYEASHKRLGLHLKSISKGIIYIVTAGLLNGILIILDKNAYNAGLTVNEMILFGGIANIIIAFIMYGMVKKSFERKGSKYLYIMTPLMIFTIGMKFLCSITYTAAMKLGNATIVVPITASSILLVAILSAIFLNERLKKLDYLCIVIFMISIIVLII